MLADYSDLPESVRPHFEAFEDYIGETDGKSVVTWAPESENSCVDDGTIDASEAVTAFNGLVAVLRSSPDSKLEAYRKALETEALAWAVMAEKLNRWAQQSREGGWSTHQVQANQIAADDCARRASRIHQVLAGVRP